MQTSLVVCLQIIVCEFYSVKIQKRKHIFIRNFISMKNITDLRIQQLCNNNKNKQKKMKSRFVGKLQLSVEA